MREELENIFSLHGERRNKGGGQVAVSPLNCASLHLWTLDGKSGSRLAASTLFSYLSFMKL